MHPHYVVPLLSTPWTLGLVGSILLFYAMIRFGQYALSKGFELRYRYFLIGVFIIREVYLFAYTVQEGLFTIQDSLPLHLCGISYISMIIFLLKPNYLLFEFLLLLSLGGAVQSLITPELTHGYSVYFLVDFYFSHAAIIFGSMYGLFVFNMRPLKMAWLRIWISGHILLGAIYLVNLWLDSNYIYLMRAPEAQNPLILRPYPMHLLGFELFGSLHILLFYWLSHKVLPKPKPVSVKI